MKHYKTVITIYHDTDETRNAVEQTYCEEGDPPNCAERSVLAVSGLTPQQQQTILEALGIEKS